VSEVNPRTRRPPRRSPWPRRLGAATLVLLVFAIGIAIGRALDDGPPPPATQTYVRTLETPSGGSGP